MDHQFFYKVCIIITNSDPEDLDNTINQIVVSSFKPVSFIIISVVEENKDVDQENFKHIKTGLM